ncbi:co-chaperone GroES [candidate division KSB1 bacterium]|nr:co-chaperone GroES [candidate division KSB1 bacterium]
MAEGSKLVIIGERVLIAPDKSRNRTDSGLYLPQGVEEKEKVQSGYVVKVGPGYILPHTDSSEPWLGSKNEPHYIPLQVKEGDYAIFLRREAIEIEYDEKKYLIVPQSGILAVERDEMYSEDLDE